MEIKRKMANFCKDHCPVCTRARKNPEGFLNWTVKNVERKICPFCKSYESIYKRPAHK